MLQAATEQLQVAQAAERQPVSLHIAFLDESSSSRVAATLTPVKAHAIVQGPAAFEIRPEIGRAIAESITADCDQSQECSGRLAAIDTPASKPPALQDCACATPGARRAAAQLLRGLGMTQEFNFGLTFDVEPEWPAGPPPSLAGSPLMAQPPASRTPALTPYFGRALHMGNMYSPLDSGLTSEATARDNESPQQPKAPLPTPAGTPAARHGRPLGASAQTLDASDIATAFALAHEQLRTSPVAEPKQSRMLISPIAFALPQAQDTAQAFTAAADEESPVVKTTRQVSSVLAAVAQLEAAQGGTGKRAVAKATRPPNVSATKPPLTPGTAAVTPAHRFSTRFIQSPAVTQAAAARRQELPAPALSNVANPLFSPLGSALDPMLTPFYTPASMSSIRTGCENPASGLASSGRPSLAGSCGSSPVGLATPACGGVTADWRSVTDRLQALRAQLHSAQKKLRATSEVGCSIINLDVRTNVHA